MNPASSAIIYLTPPQSQITFQRSFSYTDFQVNLQLFATTSPTEFCFRGKRDASQTVDGFGHHGLSKIKKARETRAFRTQATLELEVTVEAEHDALDRTIVNAANRGVETFDPTAIGIATFKSSNEAFGNCPLHVGSN
jgi:hypothetical protein